MYDIKWIRENADTFDRALGRRPLKEDERVRFSSKELLALDDERRAAILKSEQAQARRNAASKEIGEAKKNKDDVKAAALMTEVAELKTKMPEYEKAQAAAIAKLDMVLAQIPNLPLPAPEVPDGADETGNVEKSTFGNKRDYSFKPKEHFDLGADLGMMDFELAAKLSGARFVVLQKGLARLERALGQFFLDTHTSEQGGYIEVNPPAMVLNGPMFGTAQLPKFREDQFEIFGPFRKLHIEFEKKSAANNELHGANIVLHDLNVMLDEAMRDAKARNLDVRWVAPTFEFLSNRFGKLNKRFTELNKEFLGYEKKFDDLVAQGGGQAWLIPTAEVPLTNLVRESIVDESTLPRRYTACTPCFRAEAGAAGRDTRGMIRQHQFTKVELVSIVTPEKSKEEHERMLACAEAVLKKLDLHYRVITLCAGDMGFASQKTYDIEVWLPGQNMYREISSCSVCGDFQARRMNARYRGKDGKPAFVHTLNGSGVAVGRALIAVMETYQQEDGSILVPEALKPYMGGMTRIEKAK